MLQHICSIQRSSLGGYESRLKIGIELGNLTGKSRKTTFNDGISISFACTVYIDYVSSHLRIYVLRNFRFVGFELRGFILPGRHSNPSGRKSQALSHICDSFSHCRSIGSG